MKYGHTRRPSRMSINLLRVIFGFIDDVYLVGGTEKCLMIQLKKAERTDRSWLACCALTRLFPTTLNWPIESVCGGCPVPACAYSATVKKVNTSANAT